MVLTMEVHNLKDMKIPDTKWPIIEEAERAVATVRGQHERGLLTPDERYQKASPKFKVISFAPLIGEAIRRIHEEESVSCLFV